MLIFQLSFGEPTKIKDITTESIVKPRIGDDLFANSLSDFHQSHTEIERNPEADRFLHKFKAQGKRGEELLLAAVKLKDTKTLQTLKDAAPAIVSKNFDEIVEHAREMTEFYEGASEKGKAIAETMDSKERQKQLRELREAAVAFAAKWKLDKVKVESDSLTYATIQAKTDDTRADILKDAAASGFTLASILSTAKYLDSVYKTDLASQYTPVPVIVQRQAVFAVAERQRFINDYMNMLLSGTEGETDEKKRKKDALTRFERFINIVSVNFTSSRGLYL